MLKYLHTANHGALMTLDAGTFVISLSLDALLCCAISAALTKTLHASSEALWRWSGAMLCYAASFVLFDLAAFGESQNAILSRFLPHAFALAGSVSLLSACQAINSYRAPRWPLLGLAGALGALAIGLAFPQADRLRDAATLFFCAIHALVGSYYFASETRWRSNFGGWLAILSILFLAMCCAALGLVELSNPRVWSSALGPFLFFFEATMLAGSFAFILGAGEIARSHAMELSMRDGLTGLLTRRAFFEASQPALAAAKRSGSGCAMLMVDIDHFKRVNDVHGHLAGDAAIAHASAVLLRSMRASDICARFGGEEFCALLPETDMEGVLHVAERILQSARKEPARFLDPRTGQYIFIPYTLSLGAHWQEASDDADPQILLAKADAALYASKRDGRDRYTMSSPTHPLREPLSLPALSPSGHAPA